MAMPRFSIAAETNARLDTRIMVRAFLTVWVQARRVSVVVVDRERNDALVARCDAMAVEIVALKEPAGLCAGWNMKEKKGKVLYTEKMDAGKVGKKEPQNALLRSAALISGPCARQHTERSFQK
ncbi:hypothetical protein BDK51DRAFT_33489 [Blyttiomyces helicus]|uniref:Uncharacterized protein n=1 Tax=Blyttiomyces helicus TaxID=388810 RepID=A0A4P9W2Z8_9FUNG|nr:hypothetical protein BDK51DRAFT_33489 [Blyttiomyces helicus]|eukprot:RKO84446.1 hypothetical protein BDK51DRAFT_33489 [Blyttiomyces helicus]